MPRPLGRANPAAPRGRLAAAGWVRDAPPPTWARQRGRPRHACPCVVVPLPTTAAGAAVPPAGRRVPRRLRRPRGGPFPQRGSRSTTVLESRNFRLPRGSVDRGHVKIRRRRVGDKKESNQ